LPWLFKSPRSGARAPRPGTCNHRWPMALRCLAAAAFVLVACVPPPSYSVRRAALVPAATPPTWSGQSLREPAEASLAASGQLARPEEGEEAAGIEIPRVSFDGTLRVRLNDVSGFSLSFYEGLDAGATRLAADQPEVDQGDVRGAGLGLNVSLPVVESSGVRLALIAEALLWSVPNVEVRTCVDNCVPGEPITSVAYESTFVGGYSASLIPSWRRGPWTVHGGLSFRTHPTMERGGVESDFDESSPGDLGDVTVTLLHAGAEYELGNQVRLGAVLYQVLYDRPAAYPPGVALTVTIPLVRRKAQPAPL
jgi:hypothetical protein